MKMLASSGSSSSLLFQCCTLFVLAYSGITSVAGEASGPLLGGLYQPTTDVSSIVALTELLSAIAEEPTYLDGLARYTQIPPGNNGFSLESISAPATPITAVGTTASGTISPYLNTRTNPLYSIYMYALWRSPNGSGKDGSDNTSTLPSARSTMTFLKKPVDNYGHTIISDEFSKSSGYDAELTAETIRATDVWMAVVQSLYDAVALCDEGKDPTAVSGGYSNPVDVAAAFWFGDLADGTNGTAMESSGTMYAWAKRARDNFALVLVGESSSGFDANAKILEGLNDLQSMLPLCWPSDGSAAAGDEEPNDKEGDVVLEVRMMVDDVVRYMTVPLVQNLIHYSARVAEIMEEKGESDVTADEIDYVILYGLVTIPPITICDETAYDSLYKDLITNAKADRITTATLYNMLISLHSRLLCLGIECDWIGESNLLSAGIGNSTFPTCQPPSMDFKGYAGSDSSDLLERMKVDLDIRTSPPNWMKSSTL